MIKRQLSLGDREHIRTGLLGIACFNPSRSYEQALAAILLGDKLKMMARFHVNLKALSAEEEKKIYDLFMENQGHQLEPHNSSLNRKSFDTICHGSDFIVFDAMQLEPAELAEEMRKLWFECGARFLQGNFAFKSAQELAAEFPSLWNNTDEIWRIYCDSNRRTSGPGRGL